MESLWTHLMGTKYKDLSEIQHQILQKKSFSPHIIHKTKGLGVMSSNSGVISKSQNWFS